MEKTSLNIVERVLIMNILSLFVDHETINVNGLEVRLGMESILCSNVTVNESLPTIALRCDFLTYGRRVRISLPYERLFSVNLCEVQVFVMLGKATI